MVNRVRLLALFLISSCGVARIPAYGITSDAEASAAIVELNRALLYVSSGLVETGTDQYTVRCDKRGAGSVTVLGGFLPRYSFNGCESGEYKFDGQVTWELSLESDLTGGLSLHGAIAFTSPKVSGTFTFDRFFVSFVAGVQKGTFKVGDTPFVVDPTLIQGASGLYDQPQRTTVTIRTEVPDARQFLDAGNTCSSLASTAYSAQLLIEGNVIPCPLTVDSNHFVHGDCPGTFPGTVAVALQWVAQGPSHGHPPMVLAESLRQIDLANVSTAVAYFTLDPDDPSQRPKTKALATDSALEKRTFNCDEAAGWDCDSPFVPGPMAGRPPDTCTNWEELCAGTLFAGTPEQCP